MHDYIHFWIYDEAIIINVPSNYIWVINKYIAYQATSYIRYLTVCIFVDVVLMNMLNSVVATGTGERSCLHLEITDSNN